VACGSLDIGDFDYVMDIWVHRRVGASNTSVVCPKKNYNHPCPICEEVQKLRNDGNEDYKQMQASRRVYYNIIDMENREKGIMILSASHFLF
jgi:hypothetical protein